MPSACQTVSCCSSVVRFFVHLSPCSPQREPSRHCRHRALAPQHMVCSTCIVLAWPQHAAHSQAGPRKLVGRVPHTLSCLLLLLVAGAAVLLSQRLLCWVLAACPQQGGFEQRG